MWWLQRQENTWECGWRRLCGGTEVWSSEQRARECGDGAGGDAKLAGKEADMTGWKWTASVCALGSSIARSALLKISTPGNLSEAMRWQQELHVALLVTTGMLYGNRDAGANELVSRRAITRHLLQAVARHTSRSRVLCHAVLHLLRLS